MRRWALPALIVVAVLVGGLPAVGARAQEVPPGLGGSLRLEALSASSLTVTWSWSGRAASAFEVAWRARGDDDDETAWRTARKDADDRRHVIENLDAGVHYVVRVRGLDAADRPIDDLRNVFATNWSAPRLLRVIASDDGALTVAWSQPSDWTPQGWRLSWRVAGSQTAGGTIDLPAAARSRRIDGLSTGADYRIRLTALNSRGGESPAQTLRATAADAGPATPRLTALSWSGLTIRAEWEVVPRASGYDLIWRASDESSGLAGRLEVAGTSAEFDLPAAGAYWVELQARIGAGPTARYSDRTPPRNLILRPAPHYLRALSFDGERVRLVWPGTNAPHYDLEWGEQGGTKQTETRDGRSGVLEVGPLAGGTTYEFRVRARNVWGASGWSPTATLTPTLWPQLPPRAALNRGSLYVLWPPAAGAEWYEAQWINAADRAETARVRVAPPGGGGNVAARIGREGGFEDGRWLVRVRAGPFGLWSQTYALDLAGQPPRLALELESSRDLCTAGTLTEVSWKISGGSAPYALSVENSAVDVSADNIRVNCGALTEAEAGDAEAALAAKTVSAVVTDSRGVQRQAALDVQRARALPAPQNVRYAPELGIARTFWDWVEGAGSQSPEILAGGGNTQRDGYLVRYRAAGAGTWIYAEFRIPGRAGAWEIAGPSVHEMQVAAVRHSIEAETPAALRWSETLRYVYATAPENAAVSATATTVTVSWDAQPLAGAGSIILEGPRGVKVGRFVEPTEPGRHSYTFSDVPPETSYEVVIDKSTPTGRASGRVSMSVRTSAEPPGSAALPVGPQNVRAHATLESITVTWEAPHAGASDRYNVEVVEEATNALVDIHWINGPDRSVTLRSVFQRIRPATKYRVRVTHAGIVTSTVELVVTTPAAGPSGAQSDPPAEPPPILPTGLFFPYWPARLDNDFAYTDDPFDWRKGDDPRYHAAIDIGFYNWAVAQDRTGAIDDDAPGEPVYAAAAGTLRIINDNFDSLQYLLYCPNESSVLQEQFVVHDEHEKYDETVKQLTCHYFVGPSSGRTAVILHELVDGSVVVTKYAHLRKGSIPDSIIASLGTVNGYVDHNKSVDVSAGTKIGEIGHSGEADSDLHRAGSYFCRTGPEAGAKADCSPGNWALKGDEEECAEGQHCEHAFIDPHIHFEVRYFQGQQPFDWYDWAWGCDGHEDNHHSGEYCQWTATRRLATVIDPETVLPPAPASWEPRDAGLREPSADCPVRGRIECANESRRVIEIAGGTVSVDSDPPTLNAQLSVAAWRPALYARFAILPVRFDWQGIRGTRPGVNGYWTSTLCPNQTVESSRGLIDQTIEYFQGSVSGDGPVPTTDGEVPREVRRVRLTQGSTCTVIVYTSNAAYPRGEYDATLGVRVIRRTDIALSDPNVTLTWIAELSAGTDVTRSNESLTGDDLDLYAFTARRGYTYRFCTMPNAASTCAPEAEPGVARKKVNNVAELLIIGPDDEVEEGITRNAQGLKWVVPNNGPANDDYILVVRRRARWEGSGDPYSYNLKYTVPPIGVCDTLRLTLGAFLFVCTPPKPTDLSATTTDDTITATVTPSAGALEIEFAYLAAGANCTTTTEPAATVAVASSDAASGAAGAASATVSHPFGGLSASTTYKLCARAVRTIETGFVLRSGWVEASATTKAQQLAAPGSATPGSATTNSLTLTWTAVSDEDVGQYRVKHNRSTTTWTVASTETSYTFTGLSAGTAYILSVRALAKSGSGRTDSQWAPAASARTKAQSTPPPVISPLTLTASVEPEDCYPGEEVSVSWSGSGGRGAHTYEVDDERATSPTKVVCQDEAGDQEIEVSATDSAGSTTTHTLSVTVLELREPINCLSSTVTGQFVTYQRGCGSTQAVSLLTALRNENSEVCGIGRWEGSNWLSYEIVRDGRAIPGSADFTINTGHMLWFVACGSESDSDGAVGASGGEPPHCPDAPKPEAGPAVVGLDSSSCAIVRGGGAVQVSRGDYTLSLTLPSERDWFVAAPTHYNENAGGAFLLLDLASGGWAALDPAGGAELARYAPVDAEGVSALLDAIGASVFVPAAGE